MLRENWSPSMPLLIVSKLASETVFGHNPTQMNLSRPYKIVSNMKENQASSQTPCSSAYHN